MGSMGGCWVRNGEHGVRDVGGVRGYDGREDKDDWRRTCALRSLKVEMERYW